MNRPIIRHLVQDLMQRMTQVLIKYSVIIYIERHTALSLLVQARASHVFSNRTPFWLRSVLGYESIQSCVSKGDGEVGNKPMQ